MWTDFARLYGASRQWVLEILGARPPPIRYDSESAVRSALEQHPIYCWLAERLPETMRQAGQLSLRLTYHLVWEVLSLLVAASVPRAEPERRRPDKQRKADAHAVTRVRRALAAGRIPLRQAERELLAGLLDQARSALGQRQRRVDHPELQAAARVFALRGVTGSRPVLEVAALLQIACDARSARRYMKLAGEVWSDKRRGAELHWSILPALERDYRERKAASP
jgi:hypothetical protein